MNLCIVFNGGRSKGSREGSQASARSVTEVSMVRMRNSSGIIRTFSGARSLQYSSRRLFNVRPCGWVTRWTMYFNVLRTRCIALYSDVSLPSSIPSCYSSATVVGAHTIKCTFNCVARVIKLRAPKAP